MKTNFKKWLAVAAVALGVSVAVAPVNASAATGPQKGHTYVATNVNITDAGIVKDNAGKVVEVKDKTEVVITWSCQANHNGNACKESFDEVLPEGAAKVASFDGNCGKDGWVQYQVYVPTSWDDNGKAKDYKLYKTGNPDEDGTKSVDVFWTYPATGNHDYSDEKLHIVVKEATCTEKGEVIRVCKVCDYHEKKSASQPLGHDWEIVYRNIKNVNVVNGVPNDTLIDVKTPGSYDIYKVCKRNSKHEELLDQIKIPVAEVATVKYMSTDYKPHEYYIPDNSYDRNGVMNVEYEASYTAKHEKEILAKIWTYDCEKDGVVVKVNYDKNGKIIGTRKIEIPASHHMGDAWYEHPSDNKNIDPTMPVLAAGVKVVNKTCAKDITYEENNYCVNPYCSHYRKGTNTPLKSVTHTAPKSNNHQFNTEDEWKLVYSNHCKTKTWYKTCRVCGYETVAKVEELNKPEHLKTAPVVENLVEPTAHVDGSYDSVVYCGRCGDEVSRDYVMVPRTNKDDYNWETYFVWEGYKNDNLAQQTGYLVLDKNGNFEMPKAFLYAVPTDDDISEEKRESLRQEIDEAKVTVKARSDGDENTLGKVVLVATAKGTSKKLTTLDSTPKNKVYLKWDKSEEKTYKTKPYGYKGPKEEEAKPTEPETTEPETTVPVDERISIKGAQIEGRINYRGEYSPIPYTITLDGKKLKENVDFVFTNTQKNTFKVVGPHKVTIEGIGKYKGSAKGKLYIDPAKQKIKVSLSKKTFKASALKKKAASFQITVTNNKGKVTYSLKKNNKKIEISKKGKVTLKKGLKAGKYQITVKAAATKNYKAASKTVTFTVK